LIHFYKRGSFLESDDIADICDATRWNPCSPLNRTVNGLEELDRCADGTNKENSAKDVVTFDEHCYCDPQSWSIAVHRPVSGLARVATETKGDQSVQKVRYLPRRGKEDSWGEEAKVPIEEHDAPL